MAHTLALAIAAFSLVVASCAPAPEPTSSTSAGSAENASARPSQNALRWSIPSCPLRYEVLTEEVVESEQRIKSFDFLSLLSISATPQAESLELQAEAKIWNKRTKHLPFAITVSDYPKVALTTDGSSWASAKPSVVLTGIGTQGGISWLFPSLPTPGSATWAFQVDQSMLNQNGAQLRGFQPGKPAEVVVPFALQQESERATDGSLLIRSSGKERWSSNSDPSGPPPFAVLEREGDVRAEHVVQSNGRLLRAKLERDVKLTLTVSGKSMISNLRQRSVAQLVSACDGPTLPTLMPKLSNEERAIVAAGELGTALYSGAAPEAVTRFFSKGVLRGRAPSTITEVIGRYRKSAGDQFWPVPVFLDRDDDVRTDSSGVLVHVKTLVPVSANSLSSADFNFTFVEEEGQFVVASVTASLPNQVDDKAPPKKLLEISAQRLFP